MHSSRLAVTWVWVTLAFVISAKCAPSGTRRELELSDRPVFTADTSAPLLTFSDGNGNHLGSTDRSVEQVSTTPRRGALHTTGFDPPIPSLTDFSHYVPSAIAEIVHPPLSGPMAPLPESSAQPSLRPSFPHASWAAPLLQSGVFAPIPHVEQTTVTIISTEATPNATTANVTQSSGSSKSNDTIAFDGANPSASAPQQSVTQPLSQNWWPTPNDTASQNNITAPVVLPLPNATSPLPSPNDVQAAQRPATSDDDRADDNIFAPDFAANTTAFAPPFDNTSPRAAVAAAPPQRRGLQPARLPSHRRGLIVQMTPFAKRQIDDTGCRKTGAQVLVPVTHTELYEIRAGRLDPSFTAHERLSSFDGQYEHDDVYTGASCPSSLQHHHIVLVPVSESQLADIDAGRLHLEVSNTGQIVLQLAQQPVQSALASSDLHAVDANAPTMHFVEHDPRIAKLAYDVAWPERRSHKSSAATQTPPRLVRRILESHALDAKLVGNGENKTYHGRVIHNAGDGPYEDAHTIHLDSAPETKEVKQSDSKPADAAPPAPSAEPVPAPVIKNDKPKWKQGDKAGKKKKKGGPGKDKSATPAPAGPDAGSAPPLAAAGQPVPLDRDDRHDRDDLLDDVRDGEDNEHDRAAGIAYWDGKSDPSKVAAEKSKAMHNAATSLLAKFDKVASLPCSLAAISLSTAVVVWL